MSVLDKSVVTNELELNGFGVTLKFYQSNIYERIILTTYHTSLVIPSIVVHSQRLNYVQYPTDLLGGGAETVLQHWHYK